MIHLEEGINCCGNGIFSVTSTGISIQSASPDMISLLPQNVAHLHEGVGRGVPVPGQLVLSNCALVTIQASLDITGAKERTTESILGRKSFTKVCFWRQLLELGE